VIAHSGVLILAVIVRSCTLTLALSFVIVVTICSYALVAIACRYALIVYIIIHSDAIRLATVRSGPDRSLFWRPFKKTGPYGPAPPDCSSVPKILDRTVRSGLFII
jgi:hypothetical protein